MAEVVVRNLTKTFGKDRAALSDVSLSIESGEMVALIGASGSGKSTLIRHLAGITEADRTRGAGEIEIGGHPVQSGTDALPDAAGQPAALPARGPPRL